MICGKIEKISGTCVKPSPILNDNAAIIIFLCEKPHFAIICKPLITILPNIISVQPPSTASGNVASNVPNIGNNPAKTIITQPVKIVNLFTTFVIETSPTFWLNDVIGKQPKSPDNALTKPSAAIEPVSSFFETSRFNPDDASADVSPIVSVADTRKITNTEIIAPILNVGLIGSICGSDTICAVLNPEKSTIPIHTATI